MMNPQNILPVSDDEQLVRFITHRNQVWADNTVKPDLFIPFQHTHLSVMRHREATEKEIWHVGQRVAVLRGRGLHGRSDVVASDCRIASLDVTPDPIQDNPNHANIVGFPPAKQDQKALAEKIAAHASKRIVPP